MGASEVHVCGIAVAGFDAPELSAVFDSRDVPSGQLTTV
jgi:hypothetical protein